MERIAIDMDDVLVDTHTAQVAWYRDRFGYAWSEAEQAGRELHQLVSPEHRDAHEAMLHEGAFFADLPPMPGAAEVVRRLSERYEVFVASAATEYPASFSAKFGWLRRHLPFHPGSHVVFCGDKSILAAEYLIDDSPHHFARFRGQGILFSAPKNLRETRYSRVASWEEVARRFLGA
ncbi:MAG: hypothetical protein QM767_30625 [Anaeromyxobacter sp.]